MEPINCGYTPRNGSPFCMAWLYLPRGRQLYTGTIENIHKHTENLPLCHGSVVHFCKTWRGKHRYHSWEMFGFLAKTHRNVGQDLYYWIYHCSIFRKEYGEKRSVYILYRKDKEIHRWRKMPNQYLRVLKNKSKTNC